MPLTFIKNEHGKLAVGSPITIDHSQGWWNSIAAADFDEDGDIDYIIGNLGLNTRHKASTKEPLCIYAKDFDKNKSLDAIVTLYLKDQNGERKEYTANNRDDIIEQLPILRKKFLTD